MKRSIYSIAILLTCSLIISSYMQNSQSPSLEGAWHRKTGDVEEVLIFQDGYFSHTSFDKANKKFIQTRGGKYEKTGSGLKAGIEFNSASKETIGQSIEYKLSISNEELSSDISGTSAKWKRIDNGVAPLAGNWRISGRMQNGELQQMQRGARKTLKLLSGTRFQWMAINPETKEFFGTGGGNYTFKDGKYTENIEFFSRDSSRVGASLSFEGSVTGDAWNHKGMSSRGEPINEVWSRER